MIVFLCFLDFLASAFSNLVALNAGISSFIFAEAEPWNVTVPYCKIEGYMMNAFLQMSRYLILTACFDRYALCSRNARLRKFCRVHVARRYMIPSIILIWLVIPLHVPVLVTVVNHTCTYIGIAAIYNSIYGLVMIGILPPGLMFIFSLLIYRNLKLRKRRRQIHPVVLNNPLPPINENQRPKIKDEQVFAMLLVQVFAYVASSTPYTITSFYVVLNTINDANESIEKKSTITFISFFTDTLRFVCPVTSFYLFLLVSRLYRNEMMLIIRSIHNRFSLLCKRNDDNQHNSILTLNPNLVGQAELQQEQNPTPMTLNLIVE
jgi:hypothetical protein